MPICGHSRHRPTFMRSRTTICAGQTGSLGERRPRYGNMSAQMKRFIDTTGGLWLKGELEDKATGVFTSTATIHGGQETTILTALVPLIHLGMVFVGTPYAQNPQILVTDGIGGSPYGPGTLAGPDGSRQPVESELTTAGNLGSRLARVASSLKNLSQSRASAP